MPPGSPLAFDKALGVLRQFRGARRLCSRAVEHCELCSVELIPSTLISLSSLRGNSCALARPAHCSSTARRQAKYKRVLDHIQYLPNFAMTDAQWESLVIPINLAFFFRSSLERPDHRALPQPRRRGRVDAAARHMGCDRRKQPGVATHAVRYRSSSRQSHSPARAT